MFLSRARRALVLCNVFIDIVVALKSGFHDLAINVAFVDADYFEKNTRY